MSSDTPRRSQALPKRRRLAKRREFLATYETGRKTSSRFTVIFSQVNGKEDSRLGVTVTRKVGKAHDRNRVRRWVRETYRQEREHLKVDEIPVDLVVNVKPGAAQASYSLFSSDFVAALRRAVQLIRR